MRGRTGPRERSTRLAARPTSGRLFSRKLQPPCATRWWTTEYELVAARRWWTSWRTPSFSLTRLCLLLPSRLSMSPRSIIPPGCYSAAPLCRPELTWRRQACSGRCSWNSPRNVRQRPFAEVLQVLAQDTVHQRWTALKVLPQDRVPRRLLVELLKALSADRVQQRFVAKNIMDFFPGQSSTTFRGEEHHGFSPWTKFNSVS